MLSGCLSLYRLLVSGIVRESIEPIEFTGKKELKITDVFKYI